MANFFGGGTAGGGGGGGIGDFFSGLFGGGNQGGGIDPNTGLPIGDASAAAGFGGLGFTPAAQAANTMNPPGQPQQSQDNLGNQLPQSNQPNQNQQQQDNRQPPSTFGDAAFKAIMAIMGGGAGEQTTQTQTTGLPSPAEGTGDINQPQVSTAPVNPAGATPTAREWQPPVPVQGFGTESQMGQPVDQPATDPSRQADISATGGGPPAPTPQTLSDISAQGGGPAPPPVNAAGIPGLAGTPSGPADPNAPPAAPVQEAALYPTPQAIPQAGMAGTPSGAADPNAPPLQDVAAATTPPAATPTVGTGAIPAPTPVKTTTVPASSVGGGPVGGTPAGTTSGVGPGAGGQPPPGAGQPGGGQQNPIAQVIPQILRMLGLGPLGNLIQQLLGGQGGLQGLLQQGGQTAQQGPYAGQQLGDIPWATPQQIAEYNRTGQIPQPGPGQPAPNREPGQTTGTAPANRRREDETTPAPGSPNVRNVRTTPNTGDMTRTGGGRGALVPPTSGVLPTTFGTGTTADAYAAATSPTPTAGGTTAPSASQGFGGDDYNYISQNGGHDTINGRQGRYGDFQKNPEFARRLASAGRAYQNETGRAPKYGEGDRDAATQRTYWNNYMSGRGGLAARPGYSHHQQGKAMDIPSGPFRNWLGQNAQRFGLGFPLGSSDPNHMEMVGRPQQTTARPMAAMASAGNPANQYSRAVAQIESGGERVGRRTGSNVGLAQFGPEEERRYGLNPSNRNNPQAVSQALQREQQYMRPFLTRALGGQEPTPADYYIAHQQGEGGGPALLAAARTNPNMPANQVLNRVYTSERRANSAIHGNIPSDSPLRGTNPTAGQFVQMWRDRFNQQMGTETASRFGGEMGQPGPTPPEQRMAQSAYERMPRWGQGVYGQFRRSPNIEDRRSEGAAMAADLGWTGTPPRVPASYPADTSAMGAETVADLNRMLARQRFRNARQAPTDTAAARQ